MRSLLLLFFDRFTVYAMSAQKYCSEDLKSFNLKDYTLHLYRKYVFKIVEGDEFLHYVMKTIYFYLKNKLGELLKFKNFFNNLYIFFS